MALTREDKKLVQHLFLVRRQTLYWKKIIKLTYKELEAKAPTHLIGSEKHIRPEKTKTYAPQLTELWLMFTQANSRCQEKIHVLFSNLKKRLSTKDYNKILSEYLKKRGPRVTLEHLKVYLKNPVPKPVARKKLLEVINGKGATNRDADKLFRNAEALKVKKKPERVKHKNPR